MRVLLHQTKRLLGTLRPSLLVFLAVLGLSAVWSTAAWTSTASASSGTQMTVGLVEFSSTSPIDKLFAQVSEAQLKKDGYHVLAQDPLGNTANANQICTEFIAAHVNALAITTFAWDQMTTCEAEAKAAHVPMFFVGSPLLTGMAGAVDTTSAKPINDLFIKYVLAHHVTNVFALDYSPGTPCLLRARYREQLLKAEAPKVQLTSHQFPIPGQVVDAQTATAAWLQAHPVGAGTYVIWSCYADPTDGALAALAEAGRNVPIFTWDFNMTLYNPIKEAKVAADLYLDPFGVGKQQAAQVNAWLHGNHKRQFVNGTTDVLTPGNVVQFIKANPIAKTA